MRTVFDIRDHGAVGDGRTNDAVAIQRAIDACAAWGGGRVLVPAGRTFRSGSLVLKSRVDLHLERGARLEASGDFADITERTTVSALSSGVITGQTVQSGQFIAAYDAVDVAISGPGTIDGGGRYYVERDLGTIYEMAKERPFTVFMINCTDVSITETRFADPALWTIRLTGCESVQINRIRIRGDMRLPNGDGIDLDHCRRVTVSDCDIRCPDDAISLKTCEEFPDAGPCEDITVSNCVLETRSSALVVGVDARDPIRNVIFAHCVIRASHRGLSVNMGQDSRYENILFSDMVIETRLYDEAWWGRGEPIYVSAMPWHDAVGTIRNVRFVNVLARSENGVCIEAERPGLISGVLLENVRIELDRWSDHRGGQHDRRPYSGPDPIISRSTSGVYVRNADGVVLRHCEVAWSADAPAEFGAALRIENARVDIQGEIGPSARPDAVPAVIEESR